MSSWKPYTLPMIPGIPEVLGTAQEAAGILGAILDTLAGLLEALGQLAGLLADPLNAAVGALIQLIQELVDQLVALLQSGVYLFVDKGPLFVGGRPDGLEGFLGRFEASFEDQGDAERPQFGAGSSVSAMLFVVGGDDPSQVIGPLATLGRLFGIPALELEQQEHILDYPAAVEAGMSTPPDWRSVQLGRALPPINRLGKTLQRVVDLLAVGESYGKVLQDLAAVIAVKAQALQALGEEIQAVVDDLEAIISAQGLFVLHVEAEGIPALVESVRTASAAPPWGPDAYVAGVCLLGGTASFGPVVELLGG
ncbi:MAG: hypothetical protein ABIK09_10195 [Pseudomonadota bacterium]